MNNTVVLIGYQQATLIQDFVEFIGGRGFDIKIQSPEDFLSTGSSHEFQHLVCVTKDLSLRQQLIECLDQHGYPRYTYIHESALISPNATVAPGCYIAPFAFVASGASLASDCILGPYSMISHKSTVGKGCIIHPGTIIAGSTQIGNSCLFGFRSSVVDHITVGDNVQLGAASVMTKNTSDPGFYLGTPARKVR